MSTILICTDVVQSHFFFSSSCLGLEEYSFPVTTLWTCMVLGTREGWIRDYIRHYVCKFIDFVHNFVNINTIRICLLFVVTISTCVHQDFILLVLFGVKHVVAFLAKPNSNKARTVSLCIISRHFFGQYHLHTGGSKLWVTLNNIFNIIYIEILENNCTIVVCRRLFSLVMFEWKVLVDVRPVN